MPLIEIFVIAVGLAMDAFAVSLAAGAGRFVRSPRSALRLSFHLGLFQFLMPVVGWFLGTRLEPVMRNVDHWIAFALLSFVGGKMILESFSKDTDGAGTNPSKGLTLVGLSIATSIDALAVGISLAVLDVAIWYPSVIIGFLTACLSVIGIAIGKRMGNRFGQRAEFFGGILLVFIGIRILIEHIS